MDSVHTTTDLDICDNTTPADAGSMDMLDVSGSGKKKRKHKKKKHKRYQRMFTQFSLSHRY